MSSSKNGRLYRKVQHGDCMWIRIRPSRISMDPGNTSKDSSLKVTLHGLQDFALQKELEKCLTEDPEANDDAVIENIQELYEKQWMPKGGLDEETIVFDLENIGWNTFCHWTSVSPNQPISRSDMLFQTLLSHQI